MEGLRVPKSQEMPATNWFIHRSRFQKENKRVQFDLPAVSLGDLLDGDADLVAEVSPCVHHSIGAPA